MAHQFLNNLTYVSDLTVTQLHGSFVFAAEYCYFLG